MSLLPKFQIIIPIHQGPNILDLRLNSLLKTVTMPTHVILIDDGSPSETQPIITKYSSIESTLIKFSSLHHNKSIGCPKSLNEGISMTQADGYTVFIDSDVIFTSEWQRIIHTIFQEESTVGGVSGVLLYPQTGGIQSCGISYHNFLARHIYLNNDETKWIIEKIFNHAVHGAGAAKIAGALIAERVPTAGYLNYKRYGTFANIYADAPQEKSYAWTIAQVKSILKDETYLGNSIHNKQTNISYKNKKRIRKPQDEWFRVENTHEAIISKESFEQVQGQIANRRRQMKTATTQIFAGLLRCSDCGWSMSYGTNRANKVPYSYFNCTNYRQLGKNGGRCTAHYIRYDVLYAYVLSRLQYWIGKAHTDENRLLSQLLKAGDKEKAATFKKQSAELSRADKRKTEVDKLFAKMYEDYTAEKITEYNFNMLSQKYQSEQRELLEKIEKLQAALSTKKQTESDVEKWVTLIKQYSHPTELTAELLNTLIEKIVVHEAVKHSDGTREQEVEIFYRFVGKID